MIYSWTCDKSQHFLDVNEPVSKSETWARLKEIQPVHSEGDQPWDFFGRNDAKAETPVLWPPHAKSWFIGKDSDAGRDWGQEEKGMTEDEMAGWHHRLDGRESQWTPGVGDGQGGLVCCDSWGRKELDTTEQLNWTELGRVKTRVVLWISEVRVLLFRGSSWLARIQLTVGSITYGHPDRS